MANLQFPAIPQGSVAGWDVPLKNDLTNLNADNQALDSRINAITAGAVTIPGGVLLDSFAGATDDAKLTAALTYAAAQTIKPHIFFSNRQYVFTQANRPVFSGMKLQGLGGHGDQQRSANSIPNDIRFNGTGVWWVCPAGSTFDVSIKGLCFQGNKNSQFMSCNPGVLWLSVIDECGFNLWKNVLGSLATAMLIDGCSIGNSFINFNNGYGLATHLAGSDCWVFQGAVLCDTPQSIITGVDWPVGGYHMWFDNLEKSVIGPVYMTADQQGGILCTGSSNNGQTIFTGFRVEGRNAGVPCFGSNVRINSGGFTFRDCWFAYGATALNSNGRTGELGVITVTGTGRALFDGCWYDRATGVAETAPWIGQSGGFVRIRNTMTASKGGAWTTPASPGKPRVVSTGGVLDADSSVVVL